MIVLQVFTRYLGSYQTQVLAHVRLHHLGNELRLARCADERRATLRWTRRFGTCRDLEEEEVKEIRFNLGEEYKLGLSV